MSLLFSLALGAAFFFTTLFLTAFFLTTFFFCEPRASGDRGGSNSGGERAIHATRRACTRRSDAEHCPLMAAAAAANSFLTLGAAFFLTT